MRQRQTAEAKLNFAKARQEAGARREAEAIMRAESAEKQASRDRQGNSDNPPPRGSPNPTALTNALSDLHARGTPNPSGNGDPPSTKTLAIPITPTTTMQQEGASTADKLPLVDS